MSDMIDDAIGIQRAEVDAFRTRVIKALMQCDSLRQIKEVVIGTQDAALNQLYRTCAPGAHTEEVFNLLMIAHSIFLPTMAALEIMGLRKDDFMRAFMLAFETESRNRVDSILKTGAVVLRTAETSIAMMEARHATKN